MVSRLPCDPHRLRLLLDDRLPEDSHAEMAKHLETCPACRMQLESLAAEARWWDEAKELLRPETEEPASTLRALGPLPTAEAKLPAEALANRPSLHFLAPSDDPRYLGRLGPYDIVECIGSGGMGIVLKGFDAALNRYVAIKVLAPQLATSAAARRRFAREAQAAAAVSHEHVIAIHSVDSASGFPYLVMPLVSGRSLQERINLNGPLQLKEILRIGMQIASGLAAAHAQGLVHRDVKPANILLENGVERVMITDFGLARAVDDASLTASGLVAGTPQYMAPEQAKGDSVDHRTDLFSLGSVMYAMCTAHSPFRAETTLAVLRRICDERPRPIRDINPDIPRWLCEIIDKLHEKDASRRFQGAAEVADLLSRHLAYLQQPASAPRPPRLRRRASAGRLLRNYRRQWPIAVALLLIALLVATEAARITPLTRSLIATFARPQNESPIAGPADAQTHRQPDVSQRPPTILTSVHASERSPAAAGFQQRVTHVRQQITDLQALWRQPGDMPQLADAIAALSGQLCQLESDLCQHDPLTSPESIRALREKLRQWQQPSQAQPADSAKMPHDLYLQLHRLQRELDEPSGF